MVGALSDNGPIAEPCRVTERGASIPDADEDVLFNNSSSKQFQLSLAPGGSPVAATEAQIAAAEALIAASNAEFELTGQRTELPSSLDDPLRWKYQIVGNYYLNGVL